MFITSSYEQIPVKTSQRSLREKQIKTAKDSFFLIFLFIVNSFSYNIFKNKISSTYIMHFDQLLSPLTALRPLLLIFRFTITCSFLWLLIMINPQSPLSMCVAIGLYQCMHSLPGTTASTFFPMKFFVLTHDFLL